MTTFLVVMGALALLGVLDVVWDAVWGGIQAKRKPLNRIELMKRAQTMEDQAARDPYLTRKEVRKIRERADELRALAKKREEDWARLAE